MKYAAPFMAFGVALLVTLLTTPFVLRIAHERSLLDHPDGARHGHAHAVPRLGGIAVFAGFLAALLGVWMVASVGGDIPQLPHMLALVFGSAILFGVGLLDDLYGVSPLLKLAGQTVAALVLCLSGFAIETISLPPNVVIDLGLFGTPITVLWLVGISNAFNLIDGLDGLAGGVGLVALVAISVAAGILDRPFSALCAASLGGALLGFMRYNFPPARVFLGDSGSLTVGFILAFVSLRGATTPKGALLGVIPLFALAYPLLDTGVAMLRRWLRGHPLSRADSRHIHHQLRALGLTQRRAVSLIYFHAAIAATVGLFVAFSSPGVTVAVSAIAAVLLYFAFFGVRRLHYHEFMDAGSIVASAFPRVRGAIRDTILARDVANAISKAKGLGEINEILRDGAAGFRFANMELVAMPLQQYNGNGNNGSRHHGHRISPLAWWSLDFPISRADGSPIVDLTGDPLVLTLYCPTNLTLRAAAVDRVAPVLAQAILEWTERNSLQLSIEVIERQPRMRAGVLPPARQTATGERRAISIVT